MEKNILITGGAGFIGSNLAISFKKKYPEINVFVFDNLKRRGSELTLNRLKNYDVKFIHGDIRNQEDFNQIPKFDLMIECSAEPSVLAGIANPYYMINTNLIGTVNCLECARKNKAKIIFLSTSRVYSLAKINSIKADETETRFKISPNQNQKGISEKGLNEFFSIYGARSLYGTTKLCSEQLIQEYQDNFNMDYIINRCGIIAGPWQMGKVDQGLVSLWTLNHLTNKDLSYIGFGGTGKQVRDCLHIEDLFDLIEIQINSFEKLKYNTYKVGGGLKNSFSLLELTKICQDATFNRINISSTPETRPSDIKIFITDSTKIQALTGWTPKRNLQQTVSDISNWIKDNKEQLRGVLF